MAIARFKDLCLDASDPARLGAFWAAVLGRAGQAQDNGEGLLAGPTPQHTIWLPAAVVENRAGRVRRRGRPGHHRDAPAAGNQQVEPDRTPAILRDHHELAGPAPDLPRGHHRDDLTYRPKTERWIIPKLGRHRLNRLYPEHLYAFYTSLRAEGLAPNTIVQIHRILSRALAIAVREELISRNPCTLIDAPQPEEPESETLTAAEARALLRLTAERQNGTRWSVALAIGFRQNEALGLRRSYVDLDRAVIHVHWQIQRERYRHGCKDPHACGERLHFYPCPADCPKAKRTCGRKHICWQPCPPGCTEHGGKCPQFCPPGCTRHAKACPQRKGGWKFTRPKGKRKRSVPIPAQLVSPLRKHFEDQDAEKQAAGDRWQDWDLVWCDPTVGRSIRTTTGTSGRRS